MWFSFYQSYKTFQRLSKMFYDFHLIWLYLIAWDLVTPQPVSDCILVIHALLDETKSKPVQMYFHAHVNPSRFMCTKNCHTFFFSFRWVSTPCGKFDTKKQEALWDLLSVCPWQKNIPCSRFGKTLIPLRHEWFNCCCPLHLWTAELFAVEVPIQQLVLRCHHELQQLIFCRDGQN